VSQADNELSCLRVYLFVLGDRRKTLKGCKAMVVIASPSPKLRLQTTAGEYITIEDFHGKKNVVVYFYPKDFTKGCTAEACEFRTHMRNSRTSAQRSSE